MLIKMANEKHGLFMNLECLLNFTHEINEFLFSSFHCKQLFKIKGVLYTICLGFLKHCPKLG